MLLNQYQTIRSQTLELCAPLEIEDYVMQAIYDVSPPKWHIAHTTWFFEAIILKEYLPNYKYFNESFLFLFNSYYKSAGSHIFRGNRGTLSRPTLSEVLKYRQHVDEQMIKLLKNNNNTSLIEKTTLGLHHEQQHQELLLMDVKVNLSSNPQLPSYHKEQLTNLQEVVKPEAVTSRETNFINISGGLISVGTDANFSYDNEKPKHKYFLNNFKIASSPVTNGEYLQFIEDGGYSNPLLWLSDGLDWVQKNKVTMPRYWMQEDGAWFEFSLSGKIALDKNRIASHVTFFEADAYARWLQKRLLTEFEWEHAAVSLKTDLSKGNFMGSELLHPTVAQAEEKINHLFGDVWEWTSSAYLPYPKFKSLEGVLGEYNGKFMNAQRVLKGGCCLTPRSHIRTTYRNFYQADKSWPCTGIRLGCDS